MGGDAFNPMGNTACIPADGAGLGMCSSTNPQSVGFYIANRNGQWAFVQPRATSAAVAVNFPLGSSAPVAGVAIPPNAAVTVRWPGALYFAGVLISGSGPIDVTPTDGGT